MAHLWTVKRGVLLVDVPFTGHLLVEDFAQCSLGLFPDCEVAHPLLGVSRGQSDLEVEAEGLVDGIEEIKRGVHLRLDLVEHTEDVGCEVSHDQSGWSLTVVLDESPDSAQPRQCSAGLVSVENTKLGKPQRKLLVRSLSRVKDQTVSGTVHWLHRKGVFLDFDLEHVLGIVLPVTGRLPELRVEDVWRADCEGQLQVRNGAMLH